MDTVTVDKDELITKLRQNREDHEREYADACHTYREKMLEALDETAAHVRDGGAIDLSEITKLPKPVEYLGSFDEAIAMLEWEQDDQVKLEQRDFQRYVLNKWEWGHQFMAATSLYNAR